jgi:hypothetical protein
MTRCQVCFEETPDNDALMFQGECLACHSFRCDSDDCFSMQCWEIRWFGVTEPHWNRRVGK